MSIVDETKDILRFATSGSVDDGKSTLIGRLLYDSKALFAEHLMQIENDKDQDGEINFALATDGLKDEIEQGITIDVAYRYFSTPKRKFIIADTPGHIEYTRNMVTGASNAHMLLTLVDARNGITEQTRRHAFIGSLLHINHLVVCVNKMDLVDYSEADFQKIVAEFEEFAPKLDIAQIHFIPISALKGDNVVNRSRHMPWYQGPTLMYLLETASITSDINQIDTRFPIQNIIRANSEDYQDYRGYAGKLLSGSFVVGDEITALPSGFTSRIKRLTTFEKDIETALAGQPISLELEDELDISRGDMIVKSKNKPNVSNEIDIKVCWMDKQPLNPAKKYILKHTTNEVRCMIDEVVHKIDMNSYHKITDDKEIKMNDVGRLKLKTSSPILYDQYQTNKATGSLILIDEATNQTVAAGVID